MSIKSQSQILKMLFGVVILFLPETMGGLGLITENTAGIPALEPSQFVQGFPAEYLVWKEIAFLLLSESMQRKPLSVAQQSLKVGNL